MTFEEDWLELESRMHTAADERDWAAYWELKEQLEGLSKLSPDLL